jgi:GDP-L-fucose synthase
MLELAQMVANITGYSYRIVTDATKPDGAPLKLMEVTRLKSMGWQAKIALEDGVLETYSWFLQNNQSLRG